MMPCAGTPVRQTRARAHSHMKYINGFNVFTLPASPPFTLAVFHESFLSLSLSLSVSKSHAPWQVQPTAAAAAAAPGTASFSSRSTKTQSLPSLLQDKSNTCQAWRVEKGRPSESSTFGKRAALERKTKEKIFHKQINPARKRSCSSPRVRASGSQSERGPGGLIQYCRSAALQAIRFLSAYSAALSIQISRLKCMIHYFQILYLTKHSKCNLAYHLFPLHCHLR